MSAGLVALALPLPAALASSDSFYLKGDGVPTASLSPSAPQQGELPNFDPSRDEMPGLLIRRSNRGLAETDSRKHQLWLGPSTGIDLEGSVSLTFWSALKEFENAKRGAVGAYLLDCASTGADCVLIASGSATADPWGDDGGDWIARTIGFGSVDYSVPPGRSLAVKVVVAVRSEGDMWFAYDTTSHPSRLSVQIAPVETTTTLGTTTTTPPPATTTSSTTTTSSVATTTTLAPPGSLEPPADSGAPADLIDKALTPLPDPQVESRLIDEGLSGSLLGALELVMSPEVANALVSPLLTLEAFVGALTDTGSAMLAPGVFLLVGSAWVLSESRRGARGVAARRRDEESRPR